MAITAEEYKELFILNTEYRHYDVLIDRAKRKHQPQLEIERLVSEQQQALGKFNAHPKVAGFAMAELQYQREHGTIIPLDYDPPDDDDD